MAPIRPHGAPRHRRFRSTSGTEDPGLRLPTASEFARGAVRAPVQGGSHGRAPVRYRLIGPQRIAEEDRCRRSPLGVRLPGAPPSQRQDGASHLQSTCRIHARSTNESATRASPTTFLEPLPSRSGARSGCRDHSQPRHAPTPTPEARWPRQEPILARPRRRTSDIILQGFAVARADRTKNQPNVRRSVRSQRQDPKEPGSKVLHPSAGEGGARNGPVEAVDHRRDPQ